MSESSVYLQFMDKSQDFDHVAEAYDCHFTDTLIGRFQRAQVYKALKKAKALHLQKTIFEINCGTGVDADYFYNMGHDVIATDVSEKMINYAQLHRAKKISFYTLNFEGIANDTNFLKSDLLFSNFGGLNCINDNKLKEFCSEVSHAQQSGNQLAFVIMPRFCFMESLYFLIKGQFRSVFRRRQKEGVFANVEGVKVRTYYHSSKAVIKFLGSDYQIKRIKPIGLFVPPSYIEQAFENKTWLFNFFKGLDLVFSRFSIFADVADHYILIAEKK